MRSLRDSPQTGAIVARFDASLSNEWARDSRNFYSVAGPRMWKTEVTSGKRQEIYRDPKGAGIVGLAVSPAEGSLAIAVNRSDSRLSQAISVEGGEPRQVFEASGSDRIVLQQWSRAGDAILFTRAQIERPTVIDGPWQLWSVPINGGALAK